jgi:hypothetical protein
MPLELDTSWDDDTEPRLELDDPMSESAFDRVTAVPELPAEAFAKQVMAGQPTSVPPESVPQLASEPPVMSVHPLDPLDMQQPAGEERAAEAADAEVPPSRASCATARPGRNRGPVGREPSNLELAENDQPAPATTRSSSPAAFGRDPRDPVLELDMGEVARSGPPPPVLMRSAPATGRDVELTEMQDRYAMGDFTGALIVAESLLETNADDIDAQRYAQHCRDVLTQMYTARLGALTQRVRVAVPGDQIRWLSLDHRAGFVLSLVDGSATVEELLDISGMNRLDALRILYTLYDQRVIALSER